MRNGYFFRKALAENAERRGKKRTDPEKRQRIYKRNGRWKDGRCVMPAERNLREGPPSLCGGLSVFFDILIKQPERPPRGGHMPLCRLLAERGGTAYTSLYQPVPLFTLFVQLRARAGLPYAGSIIFWREKMRTDVKKINEQSPWQDLTEGLQMFAGGTARHFATGEWRTNTPVFLRDKCRQCLLCVPVCPDVSIPVKDGKRLDFDYDHCKGCGICVSACPFGAIEMKEGL